MNLLPVPDFGGDPMRMAISLVWALAGAFLLFRPFLKAHRLGIAFTAVALFALGNCAWIAGNALIALAWCRCS